MHFLLLFRKDAGDVSAHKTYITFYVKSFPCSIGLDVVLKNVWHYHFYNGCRTGKG